MRVVVTQIRSASHAGIESFHIDISMWDDSLGPFMASLMAERFGTPEPPSVPIDRLPEQVRDHLTSLLIEAAEMRR